MTLGQRIQELRRAAGLSQEGLGEKLNVSRQAVSKWEADGAVPDLDKLIALGKLFDVSLNELLQLEPTGDESDEVEDGSALPLARPCRRIKNLGHMFIAALALAFAVILAMLWIRVDTLERSAGVIPQPALDRNAPLVSGFNFDLADTAIYTGVKFTLRLSLVPAQSTDGMTVTFQVTQPGEAAVLIPAQRAEGGTEYSASQRFKRAPVGMTISVIFDEGAWQYTQALARITEWTPNSCTWDLLWKTGDTASQ